MCDTSCYRIYYSILYLNFLSTHVILLKLSKNMEFNPEFTLKQLNVKLYIQNCKLLQRSLLLPGKCMEINCGSGYTTRYCLLPKLQPRSTIIGTDSSKTMIEYARRNYRNNGQIDFKVLDIQTEHLPEEYIGQFDHIFSFPTVHARTNIFQEFENVYKMLKPGGSFHMCIVTIHDAFSLYRRMVNHPTFGSYFKEYMAPFHYSLNPAREIRQLLQFFGFAIQYYRPAPLMKYTSNYLLPYIFSGLSFMDNMSSKQQKDIKNELTHQFINIEKRVQRVYRNVPDFNETDIDIYDMLEIYARKPRRN